jgi:FdhE protein
MRRACLAGGRGDALVVQAMARLEALAGTDPTIAPLARLQAIVLRACEQPAWQAGLVKLEYDPPRLAQGVPLLHCRKLPFDEAAAHRLLRELALAADMRDSLGGISAAETTRAAIVQDASGLDALAASAGVDGAALALIAHLATLPLLRALGRVLSMQDVAAWRQRYCPLCAAWPSVVEQRGIDRELFPRCGRCGATWRLAHGRCAFCGTTGDQVQGYFAAPRQRESRRAMTCDACHAYLKVLATLTPLTIDDILVQDLMTLDLDLAAIGEGYARPAAPGFALDIRLRPIGGRT